MAENLREHPLGFPVYTKLAADVTWNYKLGGTPQTILVSPQGKVLRNWSGAFAGRQRDELQRYFPVRLPEIEIKHAS